MNKTKKIVSFAILLTLTVIQLGFVVNTNQVLAGELWSNQEGMKNKSGEIGDAFGANADKDIRSIVVSYIDIFLGLLGLIFTVLIVFAGYKYMTSNGDEKMTKDAINQIKYAAIGLLIILAAYALTAFIATQINMATSEI
jgi:cytochrome bd-type quinol oxidase subunit 2